MYLCTKMKVPGKCIRNTEPEQGTQEWLFAPVTMILKKWTWYMNMTWILHRCTCVPKMNFLGQDIQNLEPKQDPQSVTDGPYCYCDRDLELILLVYSTNTTQIF